MKKDKFIGAFQFTHPGSEHVPGYKLPKSDFKFKNWNYNKSHRRKYIRSMAEFIDKSGKRQRGQVDFWGEWEPNSISKTIGNANSNKLYPKNIHYPIFLAPTTGVYDPSPITEKALDIMKKEQEHKETMQNTDPFVFGDNFFYTCCKQKQTKKLEPGSVIIFVTYERSGLLCCGYSICCG